MKLVVGLGNPGKEYEHTRHNVGWRVLDALNLNFAFEKKFNAELARVDGVLYCKPQTFMNLSGQAVRAVMDFFHISPEDIVMVYDDKDVPFGTVRLRSTGSSGGHNGVESIITHIGTPDIARIRIGIQTEQAHIDTADFVLSRFSAEEETQLAKIIEKTIPALQHIIAQGIDTTTHTDIHALS